MHCCGNEGPAADLPFATGPLSALFTDWLTRANAFRAQAGLPPLLGDPAIGAASENHSRYWTLNVPTAGANVHSETPGTPGYTGQSPSARCMATGAACSSEVSSVADGRRGLVDLLGLPPLLATTAPTALSVGGGRVCGAASRS